MGNKQQTPENYINQALNENRNLMWGLDSVQKIPYPSYWTPEYRADNGGSIANVKFGRNFQFPTIGPDFDESVKNNHNYPKVNFANINAPSQEMMNNIFRPISNFRHEWTRANNSNDIKIIADPVLTLFIQREELIKEYVGKNFAAQLGYFGIIQYEDDTYKFNTKFNYLPDNYKIPIYLHLLLYVSDHFQLPTAPYLLFKKGSSDYHPDKLYSNLPTLSEFKKQIVQNAVECGNFWTTMSNSLETREDVLEFWTDDENDDLVESIRRYHKGLKAGFLFAPPGIDDYYFREKFFQLLHCKRSGKLVFNFPYFPGLLEEKFQYIGKVNHVILLYYFLMVHDIDLLFNGKFFDMEISKPFRKIPIVDIKPIDYKSHSYFFQNVKAAWLTTAEWTFFGRNNNYLTQVKVTPDTDFRKMVWEFMQNYPLRPLKVPPFNFQQWTRQTLGWKKASEEQWDDYFEWVVVNAMAQDEPFYSPPGDQLRDKEGNLLWVKPKDPLLNQYPDYGLLTDVEESWFGPQFKLLMPWTIGADWVWGDKFWDFVNGTVKVIFRKILQALRALANVVGEFLPYILLALGVVGGVFLLTRGNNQFILEQPNEK